MILSVSRIYSGVVLGTSRCYQHMFVKLRLLSICTGSTTPLENSGASSASVKRSCESLSDSQQKRQKCPGPCEKNVANDARSIRPATLLGRVFGVSSRRPEQSGHPQQNPTPERREIRKKRLCEFRRDGPATKKKTQLSVAGPRMGTTSIEIGSKGT